MKKRKTGRPKSKPTVKKRKTRSKAKRKEVQEMFRESLTFD
jgi:hypothetical protein